MRERMENFDELPRHELLGLREVWLTGRAIDRMTAVQLMQDDLIATSPCGALELTAKGRRLLVRGSPALWDMAS